MEHVSLRRHAVVRVALATLVALVAAGFYSGVAGAQTLTPGATIEFAGQFTSPEMIFAPGTVAGCPAESANPGNVINCRYVQFTAAVAGTVTLTIDTEEGLNFVDAAVHCNGEENARALASSNAGEPMTITFAVLAGDVCEVRISIFQSDPFTMEATPFNPLEFTGSITLNGVVGGGGGGTPGATAEKVNGGGKVAGGSFTSMAKEGDLRSHNFRYFNPNTNCRSWSIEVTLVTITTTPDGGVAQVQGRAKVVVGKTQSEQPFEARAEDHGNAGSNADRFHMSTCGGVDAVIDNGNVQVHPVN